MLRLRASLAAIEVQAFGFCRKVVGWEVNRKKPEFSFFLRAFLFCSNLGSGKIWEGMPGANPSDSQIKEMFLEALYSLFQTAQYNPLVGPCIIW